MSSKLLKTTLVICSIALMGLIIIFRNDFSAKIKSAKRYVSSELISNKFEGITYVDAQQLQVKDKYHSEAGFHRIPIHHKGKVRDAVWELGKNSSGISIRFKTSSPVIAVKWTIDKNNQLQNLTGIAESGMDLYHKGGDGWQYVASASPTSLSNEAILLENMPDNEEDIFELNLPMYNTVTSLEIGVKEGYNISPSELENIELDKFVFYGTSITQGASASRPGLSYPTVVGRELHKGVINLGFSSNGKLEESVGNIINEIDAELIVIDCSPNSTIEEIQKNTIPLLKQLRQGNRSAHILLVENMITGAMGTGTSFGSSTYIRKQNSELRKIYQEALLYGIDNIHLLTTDEVGGFEDQTVDGIHPNDAGHAKLASAIIARYNQMVSDRLETNID